MPWLTVRGGGGDLVWEGEGELEITSSPLSPDFDRVVIVQTERRMTERRTRRMDVTEFMRETSADYSVTFRASAGAGGRLQWTLNLPFPAGQLGWLQYALGQPFDTPEERRARAEDLERRYREAACEAFGVDPSLIGAGMLEGIQARSAEHEEAITSTRAEFPHDPLDYGRIYPEGPSRWTPPADPNEKIRSCP